MSDAFQMIRVPWPEMKVVKVVKQIAVVGDAYDDQVSRKYWDPYST